MKASKILLIVLLVTFIGSVFVSAADAGTRKIRSRRESAASPV